MSYTRNSYNKIILGIHTTMTWQQIDHNLADKLAPNVYNLWIKPLRCLHFDKKLIELSGPDRLFCAWVASHLMDDIKVALADHPNKGADIVFKTAADQNYQTASKALAGTKSKQLCLPSISKIPTFVRTLNPSYVFDEFVVGDNNAVAHSVCHALAQGDTSYGRCLYISASTGLGKSHLTHAVAHHILSNNPRVRLNYLSAQQLTSEMVRFIQARKMDDFKSKFQNSDILMLEDLQSLTGRAKTQEELSVIFDILLESGKTVILTGGRPPKEIKGLETGICSRMSSGLIATIGEPSLETKAQIVTKKSGRLNLHLSEEVTWYLAEQVKGDMRQIKSALVGLKAKTAIIKKEADLDMLKEILANIVSQAKTLTPGDIRDYIASQFRITPNDLLSKSRKKAITFPRQISMYFSRKYTENGLSDIGKAFNRDHSTVVHSIRVISDAINRDRSVEGQIKLLDKKLYKKFLS